jgi:hypothetical protein
VGLHYLKSAYNLSDELVVERWIENPYWQYFCGEHSRMPRCSDSNMSPTTKTFAIKSQKYTPFFEQIINFFEKFSKKSDI